MSDLGKIIAPNAIRFERRLPGPIERVWDCLTKPDCLAAWLAAGDMKLRPGGSVELPFDVEEVPKRKRHGAVVRGVVSRCEPPRLLEYTWTAGASKPPREEGVLPDSLVTFELEPRGDGVLLVPTHRRVPVSNRSGFCAGWHTHLGILQARLQNTHPEPFLAVFARMREVYDQEPAGVPD